MDDAQDKASIEEIKRKLTAEELVEATGETLLLKSDAYKTYTLLCDKDSNYVGYVKCIRCCKIVKHDIHKSGTSHLKTHAVTHVEDKTKDSKDAGKQSKVTSFLTPRKKLSDADHRELLNSMTYFCSKDIRPFAAVEGAGFQRFAQTCIKIGSKYGNISATDILPTRTTVASKCVAETEQCRQALTTQVKQFCASHGIVGVTTDMWQEEYKKINFVAVTVHMLEERRLTSRVLQVYQFPLEQPKTAENIRASLHQMCDFLGIKNMGQQFYFVTDQGSNIKSALNSNNYCRVACACHSISTALKHALPGGPGDKGEDSDELLRLQVAIEDVKTLVRYVKKSGVNALLATTVRQENDTRWNSLLMMVDSVLKSETELKALLRDKNESQRIDSIDFNLLREFQQFLQPLESATKALECDKSPTLHRVVLWQQLLLQKQKHQAFDSELIKQLKTRLFASLTEKFQVGTVHHLALFLHPQFRSLKKLSSTDKLAVHQLARDYIELLKRNDLQAANANSDTHPDSTNTLVKKQY